MTVTLHEDGLSSVSVLLNDYSPNSIKSNLLKTCLNHAFDYFLSFTTRSQTFFVKKVCDLVTGSPTCLIKRDVEFDQISP